MAPLIDLRSGKTKTVATFFKATELIGSGHFAEVYKSYDLRSQTDLALKIYLGTNEIAYELAKNEFDVLQKLEACNSEYFPKPKGGLKKFKLHNRHHPLIAMELGECNFVEPINNSIISLKDIIPVVGKKIESKDVIAEFWSKEPFAEFILNVCEALILLHRNEIIHRDLKPGNILLKKSPGDSYIKPFFLDFNTSTRSGSQKAVGGTEGYLPPEVISGKRKNPDVIDDLWGISRIILELIYGIGSKIDSIKNYQQLIDSEIPNGTEDFLSKALSLNPDERYQSADELYEAIRSCLIVVKGGEQEIEKGDEKTDNIEISKDEVLWARESKFRIYYDIIEILAGETEIPFYKEINDKVTFIYSSFAQDDTQSFDLEDEIISLGVNAIPSLIEESYRLSIDSFEFNSIAGAILKLSKSKQDLAKRTIEIFCTSSDYSVRKLCRSLCDSLCFFPTNLMESIIENDSLYLPHERVEIADLCINYSKDRSVMMSLNQYMCREYILNENMYFDLRDKIALRVKDLSFQEKAALIVEDTKMRIWEELEDYEKLPPKFQEKFDEGLRELFADSFSSLGDEALLYAKTNSLPSRCDENVLPIARAFLRKLAQRHRPARDWIFANLQTSPQTDFFLAVKNLQDLV